MSTWVRVLISTAVAACSSRTPPERERALDRIPAQVQVILAADGPALATTTFRRVVGSLTPHVPPSLACIVEASNTSDSVAIGVQLDVGVTVVLVTRAPVDRCPALSKVATNVYVATVGAGAPAARRADSVLASPTWERARPYLVREPVALAAELPQLRLVAVAQPDPLDAWVAIDAVDGSAVERAVKSMLDTWSVPATIELVAKLKVERKGTQVSVHADDLTPQDLATIISDTLRTAEAPTPAPTIAHRFACPSQPGNGVVSCHDGTQYTVSSVETLVTELAAIKSVPVIAGGDIVGIRLLGEPARLFQRDDVILGINSHRITESRQLAALAAHLDGAVAIAVRRDGVEAVLHLSE